MSRSKPTNTGSNSPVKFRFSFSGKTGEVKYYDKETKEDVFLSDLEFVILDRRASITGFSDSDNTSVYSNIVRNLKNDVLVVKAGKKTLAQGLYEDIKGDMDDYGGKYTANILMLAKVENEWQMGNLQLTGSALSSWMNFEAGKDDAGITLEEGKPDLDGSIITISKGSAKKKGAVKYVVPSFSIEEITPELDKVAMEQDVILQDYFDSLDPSNAPEEVKKDAPKKDTSKKSKDEEGDDLPF